MTGCQIAEFPQNRGNRPHTRDHRDQYGIPTALMVGSFKPPLEALSLELRSANHGSVNEILIDRNCAPSGGLSISQSDLLVAPARLPVGSSVERSAPNAYRE